VTAKRPFVLVRETDKIWLVGLPQSLAFVGKSQRWPGYERYLARGEFNSQTLLVYGLQEAKPHDLVDLEDRTLNPENLLGV
jgi:hypothetical protein